MSRIMRLSDLGRIVTGNTPKTSDFRNYNSKDICFVKPSDIPVDCIGRLRESEFYISEFARDKARILPKGSVLLTCIGIIGKVAVNEIECAFNQQINAIIPDCDKCDCIYLAYALSAKKDYLQALANAPVVPIINKTQFSAFQIPVPSLSVQSNIVKRIEIIDHLISLRQQQAEKLDELVKARFVEMFGDPVRNTKLFPQHELKEYIQFLTSGSRGWAKFFSDDGELFITIKNVKNGHINLSDVQHVMPPDNAEAKRTKVQAGDLLISITADLGRTGVVSDNLAQRGAYINQHLTCIRLKKDEVLPQYVSAFLESAAGKRQFSAKNQSAVKAGLNFEAIKSLRLFMPPLELQREYIAFVNEVDREKERIQRSAVLLETLKRSFMQQYFG